MFQSCSHPLSYKISQNDMSSLLYRNDTAYLVQAWDVRNNCKHNGAVLPFSAALVGRGADGVDAMA
jgi:hypothetical protein